jgi:hypothetical protein
MLAAAALQWASIAGRGVLGAQVVAVMDKSAMVLLALLVLQTLAVAVAAVQPQALATTADLGL